MFCDLSCAQHFPLALITRTQRPGPAPLATRWAFRTDEFPKVGSIGSYYLVGIFHSSLEVFSIEAEQKQNRMDHISEYGTNITCCRDFHSSPFCISIGPCDQQYPQNVILQPEEQQTMQMVMCWDAGRSVMVGLYRMYCGQQLGPSL